MTNIEFSSSELLSHSESFLAKTPSSLSREDISVLQNLIRCHNEQYYLHSDPVIDDTQYDRLFDALKTAEAIL